jgi:beta-galactosidase
MNKVTRNKLSGGMKPEDVRQKFWYGTHYYRAPSPPQSEWKEDFVRMKEMGLTTIQVRVFWRWHERKEGVYFWDDLDRLMNMAEAEGFRVIHQICLENAPQYVFDALDGFRVDIRGQKMWPIANGAFYVGGWIPCFDNPKVMKHALRFVEVLVKRYSNHPAFELWHAWNEPRCRPMGECACRHSIVNYQEWLQDKFISIEALNERYGKCWGDFDQVDAARDTADFAEMYLWRQWGASRVRDRVKQVVDLVRKLDPNHAVISHVGNPSVLQDPLFDISDDEQMVDVADMYGASFPTRYEPESTPFMICDWMRSVCRGIFSIYELYPSCGFYPEIPYYQVQQWFWTAVASGARNVFFWQFKKERLGVETDDAGIVEADGSDNPTTVDTRKSLNILSCLKNEISDWRVPRAQIAMVYDLESDLVNRLEVTKSRDSDYTGGYEMRNSFSLGSPYKTALRGTYDLLWEKNIHADIISSKRLAEEASRYRLLYLPALCSVDAERAEILYRYVENGGIIIADAGFAQRDSNTWLHARRPGAGLSERFGYRDKVCTIDPKWKGYIRFNQGGKLEAQYERIKFQTDSAELFATWEDDGSPAALCQNIGKGKFMVLGCLPGICSCSESRLSWAHMLENIITNWAEISDCYWLSGKIPASVTVRTVNRRTDERIIFAFRRYNGDAVMSDKEWGALKLSEGELLFELSHVKVWKEKV